jgi:hypothetical protein
MEALTVFLLYSLRFFVIFSVTMLWVVAMSDVGGHVHKGLFTTAELASMAVAVSVVAVCAIAALNAAVPSHGWSEVDPRRSTSMPLIRQECDAFSYTFAYSFGLRHPTAVPPDCMAGQAESFQPSQVPRQ